MDFCMERLNDVWIKETKFLKLKYSNPFKSLQHGGANFDILNLRLLNLTEFKFEISKVYNKGFQSYKD